MTKRSGSVLSESRRREMGRRALHLRLDASTHAQLEQLCAESGLGRGEQIAALIESERARRSLRHQKA